MKIYIAKNYIQTDTSIKSDILNTKKLSHILKQQNSSPSYATIAQTLDDWTINEPRSIIKPPMSNRLVENYLDCPQCEDCDSSSTRSSSSSSFSSSSSNSEDLCINFKAPYDYLNGLYYKDSEFPDGSAVYKHNISETSAFFLNWQSVSRNWSITYQRDSNIPDPDSLIASGSGYDGSWVSITNTPIIGELQSCLKPPNPLPNKLCINFSSPYDSANGTYVLSSEVGDDTFSYMHENADVSNGEHQFELMWSKNLKCWLLYNFANNNIIAISSGFNSLFIQSWRPGLGETNEIIDGVVLQKGCDSSSSSSSSSNSFSYSSDSGVF